MKASQLRPHQELADPSDGAAGRPAGRAGRDRICRRTVARELPDGSLELIDGHPARRRPTWKCLLLVVDLDEHEAQKLLALHDPLADMAEANEETLAELLAHVETENDAVQSFLDQMLADSEAVADEVQPAEEKEVAIPEAFQVVVECRDEAEQQRVYEQLTAEGPASC